MDMSIESTYGADMSKKPGQIDMSMIGEFSID